MGGKYLAFIGAYLRANVAAALEYRATLATQVLGMILNDILWVVFWVLFFTRFPVVKGWTLEDVLILWSSFAFSAGLVYGLFFSVRLLPRLIVEGQLDYYLALPKDVLVHLLVSRIRPFNLGDALFGPLLLVTMVDLTWSRVAVFLAATLLSAAVLLGFEILGGSLAFYLGSGDALHEQLSNALLHFASYPAGIFEGGLKFLLFTVIPAGFVTWLPVELMRTFRWDLFLGLAAAAAAFLGAAVLVFRAGLRRYESGNLLAMRS